MNYYSLLTYLNPVITLVEKSLTEIFINSSLVLKITEHCVIGAKM